MKKNIVKKFAVLRFFGCGFKPAVVTMTDNLEVAQMRLKCEQMENPDKASEYAIAAVDINGELR